LPLIERAIRLSPRNDQYAIAQVDYTMQAAVQGVISFDDAVRVVTDLEEAFPNEYDVYSIVLWGYQAFSQVDSAHAAKGLEIGARAVEKFPQGLAARFAYATLLLDQGYADEAIEQLEFCVESDPKFKDAKELLKEIQAEKERVPVPQAGEI